MSQTNNKHHNNKTEETALESELQFTGEQD